VVHGKRLWKLNIRIKLLPLTLKQVDQVGLKGKVDFANKIESLNRRYNVFNKKQSGVYNRSE
jgi:hypothetical protein